MHAPMQPCENVLAYFGSVISYTHKLHICYAHKMIMKSTTAWVARPLVTVAKLLIRKKGPVQ
jgi:hypothetical protein